MSNRGRGRGRGNRVQVEPPTEVDFSPPQVEEKQVRPRKPQPKSADELRRVMDIIQSRLSVIIDSLEEADNEATLKKNVGTAVKHLKQISDLLQ